MHVNAAVAETNPREYAGVCRQESLVVGINVVKEYVVLKSEVYTVYE